MKNLTAVLLISVLVIITGFSTVDNVYQTKDADTVMIDGKTLFAKNCAVCHGVNMEGNLPLFPELKTIPERMNKKEVETILNEGRNAMPSFAYLSEKERNAIIEYLFGLNINISKETGLTPEQQGKNIFIANCSRCHKVVDADKSPPDQKAMGMLPAVLGGISKKLSFDQFSKILNAGPCYMPSFANLDNNDKKAVYLYLSSFKSPETNMSKSGKHMIMKNKKGCGRCGM